MKHSKITLLVVLILMSAVSGVAYAQDEPDETYIIGLVMQYGNEAFIAEMAELGYVEGENITYMIPSFENVEPEEYQEQYNIQVQAMVDAGADLFVTNVDSEAVSIQEFTGDIPIVFARSDDPVATGAVQDLINPGGHATGVVTNKSHERRLQILTEINPATDKVYYLYDPRTPEAEIVLQQVQAVADELDVAVDVAEITDAESLLTALENTPDDADWFFLTPYVQFDSEASQLLMEISTSHRIGITVGMAFPIQGYLMGYGLDVDDTAKQAAHIVDRILRGANPGDLPVQTAENYLLVNLEAAEMIGLDIPIGILRQADVIIRPGYFDDTGD